MLRVLSDADVARALDDDRRGHEVAPRSPAAQVVLASLGLASNFQISLPVSGSKARSQPSPPGMTTCGLPSTTACGEGPWPCMMSLPGELSFQTTLPVVLSRAIKLGVFGEEEFDVFVVHAIGSDDIHPITGDHRGATRCTMRIDIQLLPHVVLPQEFGFFPIGHTLYIGADDLATVADVIDAVSLNQRRGADAFLGPVAHHVVERNLVMHGLPREFAGRFP